MMEKPEKRPSVQRRTTPAAMSRGIDTSRPSSSDEDVRRIVSGNHLDDHSQYHGHKFHDLPLHQGETEDRDIGNDTDFTETDVVDETFPQEESHRETLREVRGEIKDEKDVESGVQLTKLHTKKSTRSQKDPNLVSWDGPNDPNNPKLWTFRHKWAAIIILSSFTFISPVSSSMVAPAVPAISKDLGITKELEQQMTLSIFVLAYAVGPLFLGPLSEIYGRVIILQCANLLYFFFNLGCGLSRTKGQMIVCRFLSGLGGSAPLAIGGGVLSDLFTSEERGKAVSMYSLAPLLGPAIGPIAGGFIAENTTWRWIFYSTTIADGLIQVLGLFFLQETYAPVLLQRKRAKLVKETGNTALHTEYDVPDRTVAKTISTALVRPFRLIGTQIIVQILALYMAYLYGLMYLVLSTFPGLWSNVYHQSVGRGGLNYIALGLGFFLGSQICAPLQDRIYRILKKRNNGVGKPEFRVPLMIPGALLVPIGLLWYGWSAQHHTHWIMPDIGSVIFSMGVITSFQCIQTYIVDSYTRYAASAMGATTVVRSMSGFGFPLFAPYMYAKLHYGWGNTVLALIAVVLGWPSPIILWVYGEKLRKRSPYAAG